MVQSIPFLNKFATPCELELPWQDIISEPHSLFSIDSLLQRSSASLVKNAVCFTFTTPEKDGSSFTEITEIVQIKRY